MVKNWVLSAHKPTVENNKNRHKQETNENVTENTKEKETISEFSPLQEEGPIHEILERLSQACMVDLEVK